MNSSAPQTMAIALLAVAIFAAGVFTERVGRDDTLARLAALEQRLGQAPAQAGTPVPAAAAVAPRPSAAALAPVDVDVEGAPALGPADAAVTIVAFTDLQCPFCAQVVPTLDRLHEEYPARVRIVFKHFPLPIHPQAMLAHQATIAAGRQDRFWEMHDRVFASQRQMNREDLLAHAEALGLDRSAFERDLDDPATLARVRKDQEEGQRIGVRGTPTFVINGRLYSGAQPYGNFKAWVEQADSALTRAPSVAAR